MSLPEIEALPVATLAAPDCWLFLWTTNNDLFDANRIAETWGFKYAQTIVWRKTSNVPPFGGTFGPNHAEFLLACRKGSPRVLQRWPASVVEAPKPNHEHSRKPDVFLDLIEASTAGPYVELFARRARFGWDYWGDQSLGTAEIEYVA
jgi:N6-adenosine-specific RNA methylase IME4